ncbi:hypothetical protein [Streptomyces sp. NPDC089799]|uniref:hypothetical protein n=1 Tax=Streptomyces sp. NPDC089799 TaxID=3155066 RepID=UPI003412E77E
MFEFPVLTGTEGILVSPDEIWSALRGLAESTRPGQGETAVVMGMPLITADPTGPFARQPRAQDHAVNFLRFFTHFRREETSSLRGFLYRPADVLRLYFGSPDLTVTAIDISLNGPVETLLAAVPSLIRHEERLLVTSSAYDDPHCDRLMNAVTWGT